MKYMDGGDLVKYLRDHYGKLTVWNRFRQLYCIADGLKIIHQQGMIHRDLHVGNVLVEELNENNFVSRITDLGLCQPASEKNRNKVYGVLPYVAPELLTFAISPKRTNKIAPYTPASDVYSFGIIAYEVFSSLPSYYGRKHDIHLALEICSKKALRPKLDEMQAPQLLKDLIQRCWDADPEKRPNISELFETLEE